MHRPWGSTRTTGVIRTELIFRATFVLAKTASKRSGPDHVGTDDRPSTPILGCHDYGLGTEERPLISASWQIVGSWSTFGRGPLRQLHKRGAVQSKQCGPFRTAWPGSWSKVIREGIQFLGDRPRLTENSRVCAGSPRLRAYETYFGWGRPAKTEVTSIEGKRAILLTESREGDGGLEIGMAAPLSKLKHFGYIFNIS